MKILKVINPENVDEENVSGWQRRKAARAVIFDNEGRVGLLHVSKQKYYKLPGGGVEEGEDVRTALDRECQEELGVEIETTKEIGTIIEYRGKFKLHQTSYCFLAKMRSKKGAPNFTDEEKSEGFKVIWVELKQALRLLDLKQTADYEGKFIEERDFCFLSEALEQIQIGISAAVT